MSKLVYLYIRRIRLLFFVLIYSGRVSVVLLPQSLRFRSKTPGNNKLPVILFLDIGMIFDDDITFFYSFTIIFFVYLASLSYYNYCQCLFSFPLSSGYRLTNSIASWHFHKNLEEARFHVNVMFCSFTSIKRELYTIDALSCSLTLNNVCLFIWLLLRCIILTLSLRFVFIYKTYRKLFSNNFKIGISLCFKLHSFFFFLFCKHYSEICKLLDFKHSLLSRSTLSFRPDNAYPLTVFKTSVTKACLVISHRTDRFFCRLLYALSFL